VATLIGARADQIALVESATAAWDRAFVALKYSGILNQGARILVSSAEYASNVIPVMQLVNSLGCTLEFIPDDGAGVVDVAALRAMLATPTALVAINHCPSQNGLINDAVGIGDAIRDAGSDSSMPASPSGSCRLMHLPSVRISCPPPAASSCEGPGARASSMRLTGHSPSSSRSP
jgi:selenocysteine lyase/cysteine desulfurase